MTEDTSHRIALLADAPPRHLLVHEIYRSIQGESTFAGLPCVFVRLSVCQLRCAWCDTPYAFSHGEWLATEEIFRRTLAFDCPLVEVTGGEPLLQPETLPLMSKLADAGCTVLLETGGANDIASVDSRVHVIMDLKCPDSGECQGNHWPNLDCLKPTDQIKFVMASRRDFDWAIEVIRRHELDRRFCVLVSAVFGAVTASELAAWLLESGVQARLQLQLHKYIWDPQARGV